MQVGRAGCGQFGVVQVRCQANKLSKQAKAWCLVLWRCGGGGAVLSKG